MLVLDLIPVESSPFSHTLPLAAINLFFRALKVQEERVTYIHEVVVDSTGHCPIVRDLNEDINKEINSESKSKSA